MLLAVVFCYGQDTRLGIPSGHVGGGVSDVRLSPDHKLVVSASIDKTAWIWDTETGSPIHQLSGHQQAVLSARFSNNGRYVVTTSYDSTVKIWSTKTGELIHSLQGHEYAYTSPAVEFSPNDHLILTKTQNDFTVWDLESGAQLSHYPAISSKTTFNPDGSQVVYAAEDHVIRFRNAVTGEISLELKGHEDKIHSFRFSPDGKKLVSTSADHTTRIWDLNTALEIKTLVGTVYSNGSPLIGINSPCGGC